MCVCVCLCGAYVCVFLAVYMYACMLYACACYDDTLYVCMHACVCYDDTLYVCMYACACYDDTLFSITLLFSLPLPIIKVTWSNDRKKEAALDETQALKIWEEYALSAALATLNSMLPFVFKAFVRGTLSFFLFLFSVNSRTLLSVCPYPYCFGYRVLYCRTVLTREHSLSTVVTMAAFPHIHADVYNSNDVVYM